MNNRLDGKVAVVTGSASGIGRAITQRFLDEGANVVGGDLDVESMADLSARHGESFLAARCDVTREADVESLATSAIERFGRLDVAVANAGRGTFSPIVDHPLDEWQAIIDLCLTGVMLTTKHCGRLMNDGGSIITISSLNAIQPAAGMSAYCAAKAGVVALTRCAAMELGARGIRANAIGPGLIETNATATMFALPGIVEEFVDNATVGRYGRPDDVASMAVFLASDESTFVSGSFHSVDGGGSTGRYPDLMGAISRMMEA
jgi:NAD(P)-dependent dehydrogenase (short-subunit alcohol dehydrogenase family)